MPKDAKSLVRHFYDAVGAGNLSVIDELVAADQCGCTACTAVRPFRDRRTSSKAASGVTPGATAPA